MSISRSERCATWQTPRILFDRTILPKVVNKSEGHQVALARNLRGLKNFRRSTGTAASLGKRGRSVSPGAATDIPHSEAQWATSRPHEAALSKRRFESWRPWLVNLTLIFSDVLLAFLVWEVAVMIQGVLGRGPLSEAVVVGVAPVVTVWIGSRALLGLYPGYGLDHVEQLRRQTYALLATLTITTTFLVALQVGHLVSRLALALAFASLLVLAPLARHAIKRVMLRVGIWGKPVVIVGSGEQGGRVATLLEKEWGLGYNPVAVFGGHPTSSDRRSDLRTDEKSLSDAIALAREHGIDSIIFAMPHTRREHVAKLVAWASLKFRHVTVIPNLEGITNSAVVARNFAGLFGVEMRHNLLNPSVRRAKRALDIVATLVGGVLVLPLIVLLAVLVWLESGGSVFYRAERMGRDREMFSCLKFRTMVPDAEAVLQKMLEEDADVREQYLKYHKLREDPRVTRVGRFLRKTSLDELPQLWNVLRGEMSLVGPRPYLPRESTQIGITQSEILRVYPGITGPWQVGGRNNTSFQERVRIDAYYVRNWSLWLDLVILARTVRTLVLERGAY